MCPGQIKVVDIGGGVSTSYTEAQEPDQFQYQRYRDQLQLKVIQTRVCSPWFTLTLSFLDSSAVQWEVPSSDGDGQIIDPEGGNYLH